MRPQTEPPAPPDLQERLDLFSQAGRRSALRAHVWRAIGLTILQALALTACATGPGPNSSPLPGFAPDIGPPSSLQTLAALLAAIGDAPCTRDSQCHSVGIGARPCGGPEGYLAWSEQTSSASQIDTLAASHTAAREAENTRSGIASDCRFRVDPGATCRPGAVDGLRTCQPASGRSASAI